MTCLARSQRTFLACLLLGLGAIASAAHGAAWSDALKLEIERLDKQSPGSLGVYVKRLDNGEVFDYGASKPWYLGSTVKVPIAIAVLQQVDAGKLSLSTKVGLKGTDKVDGSGQVVWSPNGSTFTVESLLERMLGVSDNAAANMLIRTVGEEQLNKIASELLGPDGFKQITTLTQIRYDVYAQLHPDARKLSNAQLVQVAAATLGPKRVDAARNAMGIKAGDLKAKTIEEAYDRYYETGVNAATLKGYGGMLEQLVRGKLLSPKSTEVIFKDMKFGRRGDYRLEGGIPKTNLIIHKTGTQYRRACHVAVINPQDGGAKAIVVTTCAADMNDQTEAGGIFQQVGKAVTKTLLTGTGAVQ